MSKIPFNITITIKFMPSPDIISVFDLLNEQLSIIKSEVVSYFAYCETKTSSVQDLFEFGRL